MKASRIDLMWGLGFDVAVAGEKRHVRKSLDDYKGKVERGEHQE